MKKTFYKTPTLKVVEFKVENGFAASGDPFASPFSFDGSIFIFDEENNLESVEGDTWNSFWTE